MVESSPPPRCVAGCRFWVWIKWGNLAGSRRKKTGVLLPEYEGKQGWSSHCEWSLLPTKSQLPSAVLNFTAKPRGSLESQSCEKPQQPRQTHRARSGLPLSPPTVEKRTVIGHCTPFWNKFATETSSSPSVHSKYPCAPDPLAWTTRSGILRRQRLVKGRSRKS